LRSGSSFYFERTLVELQPSGEIDQEFRKLRRLDAEGCSQLLAFLLSRPMAVPYEELHEAGWEDWFVQLRRSEGVVFLEKGLNLTAELRQELLSLKPG
jgi:hypothetical protein